ncbi:MAG: NUDIX hydrolase [Pseudomonadota bacterium]
MSVFQPHVTVATVVIDDQGRFLLVEEHDKTTGMPVFNQPAGHLEADESLPEAALRETREESGWEVTLTACLGVSLHTAPGNGVTYCRVSFLASPETELQGLELDPDILARHWFTYDEIIERSDRMRSPLVIATIERYLAGHRYPLDLIYP